VPVCCLMECVLEVGQCVKHIDYAVEDAGITALKAGIFCR